MRRIASMAQGYQICHCEERSDVAISRSRLRIRRGLPVICHYAARLPRARSALAMTNLIASRRRMRAAKIANLQGAHNPQGARRIRKAAKPPTAAQ